MLDSRALIAVSALVTLPLVGCGSDKTLDNEKSASLTQPVARVELKVEKEAPGSRTGEQIYESVCASCHSSGALNAPKTGDSAAWAPRLAQGFEVLIASATNGKNAMPPKGGATDLTDAELARAVAYLANQSGGNFEAPSVDGASAEAAPAATAEAASAEAAPADAAPAEAAPADAAPAEAAPADAAPAEAAPAEAAPADAAPAGAAPAEAAPAEAAPAGAAPAEAAPAKAAPAEAAPAEAAPAEAAPAEAAAAAAAGEALAKEKNCLACHKIDAKLVGPAYQDVAEKFGGQEGAADMLAEKIQKGSSGVWGPIPMPPNTQVSPEEAKQLAEWVLSLKK